MEVYKCMHNLELKVRKYVVRTHTRAVVYVMNIKIIIIFQCYTYKKKKKGLNYIITEHIFSTDKYDSTSRYFTE